ncbi:MAG TPA: YoaK family protein [Gemmatimonadales bacterium]
MTQTHESRLARALLVQTVATGLIDAVSYLALGHVFTANMTGNVVFLAFAVAGAPGLSIPRSAVSLGAFLAGAVAGGRLAARLGTGPRHRWVATAFAVEAVLLLVAALAAGTRTAPFAAYGAIVLTALAMGVRNATVRKLALPDLTTTVLTLTLTGLAADSALAGGANPRAWRRGASVLSMFLGAAVGALLLRHSLVLPLVVSSVLSSSCAIAVALTRPDADAAPAPSAPA